MGFQWRDQLSVGNDLIDSDHKYLIEVINRAELSLKTGNRVALASVLQELAGYAKSHFDREELISLAVGYPGAAQLHESHSKLVADMDKLREDLGGGWTDDAATHFTTFLRDWLIQHLIKEDLPMKPWLTKHSPRFDPRN